MQVVWFKRDLRIYDHQALVEAATKGSTLCLFIYEPDVIGADDFDAMHLGILNESLRELDAALRARGGRLTLRRGEAVEVLNRLHQQVPIEGLWSHEEVGNDITYRRDLAVKDWAKTTRIRWRECKQTGVVRGLKVRDGWSDKWKKRMKRALLEAPETLENPASIEPGQWLDANDFQLNPQGRPERWTAGESVAQETLSSYLNSRGEHYKTGLSSPVTAFEQCSRLSMYLAYGNISMKQVAQATWAKQKEVREAKKATGIKTGWGGSLRAFQARLHWRDHFMQKLEDQPELEFVNQCRAYDGVREDDFDAAKFEAWCAGKTGYPMVDACMRALSKGGWINFRMRAMLMSFASYHLWLHWRPTSLYLARQFCDYEPGIHYTQAQMQAGVTGINAIRIYSPTKQVLDHDPEGVFIREYVPELAHVPKKYLAEPSTMPVVVQEEVGCLIGKTYPAPIVEHRASVAHAKKVLYGVRRQSETREEAQKVYEKHGSRKRPRHRK